MTDYAGNPDNYPAVVRLTDDGQLRNATTLAPAIEDLADRTASLAAKLDGTAGHDVVIGDSESDTLDVNATSNFAGETNINADFNVNGAAEFNNQAVFNGNVTIGDSGGDAATINASSTYAAPATFNSNATFNSDVDVGSDSSDQNRIHATSTFNAAAQFKDKVTFSSQGRIVARYHVLSYAGDTTKGPKDASFFYMGSSMTASRKLIIDDTDAADGDVIEVTCDDATYVVSVRYPDDSNTIGTALGKAPTGSSPFHAKYLRMGGVWYQVAVSRWAP